MRRPAVGLFCLPGVECAKAAHSTLGYRYRRPGKGLSFQAHHPEPDSGPKSQELRANS